MAKQTINLGAVANDGTGDSLRDAGTKINANFTELYDGKAPLASPALTGNPTAPTQTAGNNSTRIATTAFVTTAVAAGGGGGGGGLTEADVASKYGKVPATTTVGSDSAPSINAALADPNIPGVTIHDPTITVSSAIINQSGKFVEGLGRGRTTIKALTGFSGGTGNTYNAPVCTAVGATDTRFSDFEIDVDKVGNDALPNHISGFKAIRADRFHVERVNVKDVSGYGFHSQGLYGGTPVFCRNGVFRDIRSENCNVHIEQTCAEYILIDKFYCTDGDGDCVVESYLHPLEGSRHIRYQNGEVNGLVGSAGVGVALFKGAVATSTYALDDIVFEDVRIVCGGIGIVSSGTSTVPFTNIVFRGGYYRSRLNVGTNFIYSSGKIDGADFDGATMGFQSDDYSSLLVTNSNSTGTNNGVGSAAYGANIGALTRWEGGLLRGVAPSGSPFGFVGSGVLGPTTRQIPAVALTETIRQSVSVSAADISLGYGGSYAWIAMPTAPLNNAKVKGGGLIVASFPGAAITDTVTAASYDSGNGRMYFYINGTQAANAGWKLRCWAQEWV